MFSSAELGIGVEIFGVDWRGLREEDLNLSLMVFHEVNLSGAAAPNVVALGTGFDRCNLDGALLSGMLCFEWTSSTFINEDPHWYLPEFDQRSVWDPDSFELVQHELDDYHKDVIGWGDAFMGEWRRCASIFGSSLRGATIRYAQMSGILISLTDFAGAELSRARLVGTTLEDVSLRGANLSGANLSQAVLRRVDLSGADLTQANLTDATLEEVTLNGVVGMDLKQ